MYLSNSLRLISPFAADPEDEGTVFIVGELANLVDADAGVGGGFFQCQVGFFPDGHLFHGHSPFAGRGLHIVGRFVGRHVVQHIAAQHFIGMGNAFLAGLQVNHILVGRFVMSISHGWVASIASAKR